MTGKIAVSFFELDIPYCEKIYGVTCNAELGVTGDHKCFNTRNNSVDCQDIPSYTAGTYLTLRFGVEGQPFIASMPCIPSMTSPPNITNAVIKPGESIGERAGFSVTLKDHPHGDAGIDKYIADRAYNPFERGTFWGKFRARNPYIQSVPCRVVRGYVGEDVWDIEHFILKEIKGPDSGGTVTISGLDFMYLLSDKSAQAPRASKGFLSADISATATSITLLPAGVGSEYPASGKWSVGSEKMSFTKTSGDTFTVVRGVDDTVADAHSVQDLAQESAEFGPATAADLIDRLVTEYSPLDGSRINLPYWQDLVSRFSDTLYTASVVKPTSTEKLINELVEQAGLVLYGSTRTQQIEFDILRPPTVLGEPLDENRILAGTFSQSDQPGKRYSQVWVFYNQRDVYKNLDEPGNFYSAFIKVPGQNLYETESIKKIYSRWIPKFGRPVAEDVASRAIARYVDPPRLFTFSLFPDQSVSLGDSRPISMPSLQDATGGRIAGGVPCIITGIITTQSSLAMRAEELRFSEDLVDLERTFPIDHDVFNINLRAIYDNQYSELPTSRPITFIIDQGVVVGSKAKNLPAIDTGIWPAGFKPTIVNRGFIVGKGGNGGYASAGEDGGLAFKASSSVIVDNTDGVIGGGGGGGGGVTRLDGSGSQPERRGFGGAGAIVGSGNVGISKTPPSLEFGGRWAGSSDTTSGQGGGDLGQDGDKGVGPNEFHWPAGKAGTAVQGDTLVTWLSTGDIRGARRG